jgi:bifunctional non-homologous end joining protein LigD
MASHWVVGRAGVPCLDRAKGSAKPKSRFALTAAGRQTRVIGLARPGRAGQGAVRPREPLKCRGAPLLRLDSAGLAPIFAAMSVMREPRRRLDAEQSLPSFDPCLPRSADQPPAGPGWIHEIKHDGFRILAHRRGRSTRLVTRNGHDLADRFPLVTEAIEALPVRSCVIDGEAIVCDDSGLAVFDLIRGHATNARAILCAFDLLEVNGEDIRREPIEDRKRRLAGLLRLPHDGIALNEQFKGDGASIFKHACALGCEGIVSKRLG